MKRWYRLMTISWLFAASVPVSMQPQEAFQAKELLQKDLQAYAGGDVVVSVGEIVYRLSHQGEPLTVPER